MAERSPADDAPLDLSEGWRRSGLSLDDVYAEYLVMGGRLSRSELSRALNGQVGLLGRFEHNKLAAALNEHYVEVGEDHPVAYDERPLADDGG